MARLILKSWMIPKALKLIWEVVKLFSKVTYLFSESHPGSDVIENFLTFLFSPSGCTFWGKKPWSRKKKLLWQLGTLAGAPLGIAVVAGVALPALLVGLPLWAGRRAHRRLRRATPARRRAAVAAAVAAAVSTSAPVQLPLSNSTLQSRLWHSEHT